MSQFDNFTKEELEYVINTYDSWSSILRALGIYDAHNKRISTLIKRLDFLDIDYSKIHYVKKSGCTKKYSFNEVFKKNNNISPYTVREHFKKLTKDSYNCAICGLGPEWNGKPLVLTMDHIDGNHNNNEFSNLRWLCPNCDRQTETYSGKNKIRIRKAYSPEKRRKCICPRCGRKKDSKAHYCLDCYNTLKSLHINGGTGVKPSRITLKEEIRKYSFEYLGKKYDVSGNAVKKWCKSLNLPYRKKDIKKYSEEEWKEI